MEKGEMFSSSTVQLTWHDFLERMRQPSAAEFVRAIKSFIVSFSNNPPDPERDSAAVQQFLLNMEAAFRAHPLWAGCSEDELESAGEGLEKYVMTKLFTRVFASVPDDVKVDEQLSEKMALVQQFIRPENLDIKPTFQNESSWLLAQKELQKMNMYKAPREKLACILNCCKVITNLLHNAAVAANENPPGADEFLPVLIYVTIKANPPQLHSNLLYIQQYRRQSRMVSETAYYFTNILSAESFISNIDAKSLSMDEVEFERNMESARALLSGLIADVENSSSVESVSAAKPVDHKQHPLPPNAKDSITQLKSSESTASKSGSKISDLEEKGAATILKEDDLNNVFQEFPYVFASVGDLTLCDVEDLLNNYKQLVFKYVCLAKGLGVPPSSLPHSVPKAQAERQVETLERSKPDTKAETTEDTARKHDGSIKSSHSEIGIFESKVLEEDASVAPQKADDRIDDTVKLSGDSEAEVPKEGSAAPPSTEGSSEALASLAKD